MALLVILLCLLLQRYWQLGLHFSRAAWLRWYLAKLQPIWHKSAFWHGLGGLILLILPLPLVVGVVDELLKGWLFGLPQLLYQLGILWLCLIAYPYQTQLSEYHAAVARDDWDVAQQQAALIVRQQSLMPHDWSALQRAVTQGILLQAGEHLFGVLFWYLMLGAAGACAYATIWLLARQLAASGELSLFASAAQQLLNVLAWLPIRLTAVGYALAGHFIAGWRYCRQHFFTYPQQNKTFILQAATAALDTVASLETTSAELVEQQAAIQLIDRTLFIALVLLAVFTLGGWLG